MEYYELYEILKSHFDSGKEYVEIKDLNVTIESVPFISKASDSLHGSNNHNCTEHRQRLEIDENTYLHYDQPSVDIKDFDIECNKKFEYYILKRADVKTAQGCIIFFHGLNEKKWDKYLPWAYELAQRTRKAIILFPIAFHMNRAEPIWSDRHHMTEIVNFRKKRYPENTHFSYVNAAISSRLEAHPQRLFWSGLQTYSDIIEVVKDIKQNKIQSISPDAGLDLFGYSIGSFLSMIIKMADPEKFFTQSKVFCFCGGMTIDRMFPISKYIMDAQATIKMLSAFTELLSSDFRFDRRLKHYQNENLHPEESWFKKMLRYNYFQNEREERMREIQSQIKAYVLEKDAVAPPIEALNTLKGGYRNIGAEVEIQDFPYEYSHMVPFPLTHKHKKEVTEAFRQFVGAASSFFTQ
ncbi:hypothetical protein C1637_02185 [Chryseobacterium lactis]|uniref:Alpha/beta hydrolase n=1 Tax=Chryseobacterium lactis TaxID=1241981 RepID=A0A3G6RNC7_CHRLC|nr:DUF6051 family protein [Chryseobacterium lactis]AZA81406.1 hypothetical protein EG342_05570 [Chryseobacterium lactis]AZB06405.1 hypothetical protein EG341_21695 [Chryseobacterium lactis]PNW15257.1 hypothetical protein C1637_02185 [Chryseobacterium lactis]